ncbi:MAG: UPF0261 family protein [Planctomycetota bacterium]|nr:MAG: UPF0261 family protein [Planctomycetota bacterium]
MTPTVALLVTLDTKAAEARWLVEQVQRAGGQALLIDIGVVGEPGEDAQFTRQAVADAGGTSLEQLLQQPTRERAGPVMLAGASALLAAALERGEVQAVLGLGGTQGTSLCCEIMQSLPYGLPKIMVSTVASGDTAPFVGIKDITMMFSVGDLLGLNPVTRRILANAAGAAVGMARVDVPIVAERSGRPVVGMTNLGVLTAGSVRAQSRLQAAGVETIVFHAVGSGGRAMEAMLQQGLIGAVFDYALGEISDALFGGLRAADEARLTVAGRLGLPQVLCPGGAEHVGLLVPPNTVPERWRDRAHVFHSPVVLAPRLCADELRSVAREIGRRLQCTSGPAVMLLPRGGTSRYAVPGGPLHDPLADAAFLDELARALPASVEVVERAEHAEHPAFIDDAVARMLAFIGA